MNKIIFATAALAFCMIFSGCRNGNGSSEDSDSTKDVALDTIPLPDTVYASVDALNWEVLPYDSTTNGQLSDYTDYYANNKNGKMAFRANLKRDGDFGGTIKGRPSKIVVDWEFKTGTDFTPTSHGSWGGGSGWTGQPLYVEWPDSIANKFKATPSAKTTADFGNKEIIVASLCCRACFINFETGKASREPLDIINPVKGTPTLDPHLTGMYYAGNALDCHEPAAHIAANLYKHEIVAKKPQREPNMNRNWPGSDSSPVVAGGFLFWPSENGLIYKYEIGNGDLKVHSALRYAPKGGGGSGVESSICIYKNYGYFGDNQGHIICINLNTMKPVWYYDNHDDIDGTIVCEVVDGKPFVYTGCEVDRQGDIGNCTLVKLNGLTGEEVWCDTIPCTKFHLNDKHFDGGMYSSPLLGKGNCQGLLFTNICNDDSGNGNGQFYAVDTKTGKIVYKLKLKHYAWSSPVGFYNENNELFIFQGDTNGNVYLIEGKTGNIIYTEHIGNNFESSPVVIGNALVVGSRGESIYKMHIE